MLLTVLATGLAGCTSWKTAYPGSELSPLDLIRWEEPDRVRITREPGVELELHAPVVVGDSIVGEARRSGSGRVAVPLEDIRRLDVRGVDALKTLGLVVLSVAVSPLVLVWITCIGEETCS